MQEGRHAARNVVHAIRGESSEPFAYVDKGTLATIGRGAAVAEVGRLRLGGFVAWIAWLFIHIFYLIGFRNRFMVLAGWGVGLSAQRVGRATHHGRHRAAARTR